MVGPVQVADHLLLLLFTTVYIMVVRGNGSYGRCDRMNVVQLQGEGMNESILKKISYLVAGLGTMVLLGGCGGADYSSGSTNQQVYDTYMEMPGYYDFARPVVFLPEEENFTAPEKVEDSPVDEESDN